MSSYTFILVFILCFGNGYLAATLTPGIHGPGLIAFAVTGLIAIMIQHIWGKRP